MFDFAKTLRLFRGGVYQPEAIWESYLGEHPSLQHTAFVLLIPIILIQVVIALIASRILGGFNAYGLGHSFVMGIILGLISAALGLAIIIAVITALAKVFGGKSDWNQGAAAIALAYIPYTIACAIGACIPWLGGLVILAGAIFTLIYLYRLIPLALGVPEGRRPLHFIASLVVSFIASLLVFGILGLGRINHSSFSPALSDSGYSEDSSSRGGMFTELERQGKLTEAAEQDRYQAPTDGKLSESQVKQVIAVLEKTRKLQQREEERLKKLAKDMENKDQASIGDLGRMFQGVGSAVGLHNAEIEVVKTGGGNWAEHQWVKEQLRTAMIQQEGTAEIEHNYKLYQKYEAELGDAI